MNFGGATRRCRISGKAWLGLSERNITGQSRPACRSMGGLVALTLMLATACSAGSGQSRSTQPDSSSTKVSPDDAATLHLAGGLAVNVPRGTVAGRGTLLGMTTAAPSAAPRGMTLAGPTYDLRIAQTRLTGRVRLTVPVPPPAVTGPAGGPDDALLAFYNTAKGSWQPIAATYHSATHSLTATSPHLSLWSALRLDASTVLSQATNLLKGFIGAADTTAQPACPGTSQLSADGIKTSSDKGNLVKWCAGVNPSGAPLLRVADNRSYAMETTYPAAWRAARTGAADPVTRQIIDSVARLLSPASSGEASIIIPGGGTVQFTAPQGASGEADTIPSGEGYLIDAFLYGAETLAMTMDEIPGAPSSNQTKTAKAISLAFKAKDCVTQLDEIAHNDVSSAHAVGELFRSDVELAVGCLEDQWNVAYGLKGALGSFILNALLWLEDGIKLVFNGLHAAIDSALYWRSYRVALATGQVPNSYKVWIDPDQDLLSEANPTYRPMSVELAGDGTYELRNMTWQRWNSSEAVGTGMAYIDDCNPSCAVGGWHRAQVRAVFSHPVHDCTAQYGQGTTVSGGARYWWSQVDLTYPAGLPAALSGPNRPYGLWKFEGIVTSAQQSCARLSAAPATLYNDGTAMRVGPSSNARSCRGQSVGLDRHGCRRHGGDASRNVLTSRAASLRCLLRYSGIEGGIWSGQQSAGVPGVDLAHAVWVRWGIRGERGTDVPHEGDGRPWRCP